MVMRNLIIALALLCGAPAWGQGCGNGPLGCTPGIASDGQGKLPISKSYDSNTQMHAIGLNAWMDNQAGGFFGGTSGAFGETTRVVYTTKGPLSKLQLWLNIMSGTSGAEVQGFNPTFYYGALEYPVGTSVQNGIFTLGGQTMMEVGPNGSGTLTDPLGVIIPANTQFAIRFGTYIVAPLTSLASAGSLTGGTLAAATYYYKATCVTGGEESAPSSETSATTTGATSSVTLTAVVNSVDPVGCGIIKVYRSTSTGTEKYLGAVQSPGLIYVDNGSITPNASLAVPTNGPFYATNAYIAGPLATTEKSANCNGSGALLMTSAGTSGMVIPNPQVCLSNLPVVIGDDVNSFPVCALGDSVTAGAGIYPTSAYLSTGAYDLRTKDWFDQGLPQGSYNTLNLSLPGTSTYSIVGTNSAGQGQTRTRLFDFCSYVVDALGSNDLATAVTWQNLALNQNAIALSLYQRGKKVFITTLLPRGTTSDNMLTEAGFTQWSYEAARVNYNTWVRNGSQFSGGTPVLTGGTPSTYISGYFDLTQAMGETNSSNVPTLNGGYWPVPTVAYGTGKIAAGFGGIGTLTFNNWSGGAITPDNILTGMVVKMTSGAAAGQSCPISAGNYSSNVIYCNAGITTGSLAIGDNFSVYQTYSQDAVHPTLYGNTLIGTGTIGSGYQNFSTWAAANLAGF